MGTIVLQPSSLEPVGGAATLQPPGTGPTCYEAESASVYSNPASGLAKYNSWKYPDVAPNIAGIGDGIKAWNFIANNLYFGFPTPTIPAGEYVSRIDLYCYTNPIVTGANTNGLSMWLNSSSGSTLGVTRIGNGPAGWATKGVDYTPQDVVTSAASTSQATPLDNLMLTMDNQVGQFDSNLAHALENAYVVVTTSPIPWKELATSIELAITPTLEAAQDHYSTAFHLNV